jgi:hypothetical protein
MSRHGHFVKATSALGRRASSFRNERKVKAMRNFLTARWRRYAVAFVVAAVSLGVLGACNPTKTPTKPPPPPDNPCGATSGACLTIFPFQWSFTSFREVKTFTVKNEGPDQSLPLRVAIFGGNIPDNLLPLNFRLFQDNCSGKSLVRGDQCTVGVEATHTAENNTWETDLNVTSDNIQPPGGIAAHLIADCRARLEPCP